MGLNASQTTELIFDNARVPRENLLGIEGDGFRVAMALLDGGRVGIAAQGLGIAQGAYDVALEYAKQRTQFGKLLIEHQGVGFMLADMATRIDAARMLVYRAARLKDLGLPLSKEASMAKMFATDTAMAVTTDAVQVLGGYGYCREYPVERMMRDAKITQIYEGTNQIQRLVISKNLMKE
jgi:butyryl-CoA dehydrogenase